MSGSGEELDVYDEVNITPMLDLAYVLLVIFIIMTTASVQGIKVNLPKASAAPALAKPKTKAVSITADGTIYIDTYPVTLPELENLLRQYKAQDPDLPVIIKADSTLQYQRVVDVLDLVGKLEITQLGLVTQRIGGITRTVADQILDLPRVVADDVHRDGLDLERREFFNRRFQRHAFKFAVSLDLRRTVAGEQQVRHFRLRGQHCRQNLIQFRAAARPT